MHRQRCRIYFHFIFREIFIFRGLGPASKFPRFRANIQKIDAKTKNYFMLFQLGASQSGECRDIRVFWLGIISFQKQNNLSSCSFQKTFHPNFSRLCFWVLGYCFPKASGHVLGKEGVFWGKYFRKIYSLKSKKGVQIIENVRFLRKRYPKSSK